MGDPELGLDPLTGEISTSSVERACEQLLGSMPLQSYTLIVRCGAKGCYVAKNGGRSRRPSGVKRKRPANHARGGLTPEVDMMALFSGMINSEGFMEREVVEIDPGIERWIPAYFQADNSSDEDTKSPPEPTLPTPPPSTTTSTTTLPALSELALTPKSHSVVDPTGGGNAFLGGFSIGLARGQPILEAVAWGSVAASFAIEQVGTPVLTKQEEFKEITEGQSQEEDEQKKKGELWNGVAVEERLKEFLKRCKLGGSEKDKDMRVD
jgi:hypothetical protein